MPIFRATHDKNYTVIFNETLEDDSLTFQARGMLCYLLAKPDHWRASTMELAKAGGCGRDRIHTIMKELEGAGYVKKHKAVKAEDNGKFIGTTYDVFERPKTGPQANTATGKPVAGKAVAGKAGSGGSALVSNQSKEVISVVSNHIDRFEDFWQMWPRKKSKEDARKAWKKIKDQPATLLLIQQHLTALRDAGEWRDKQFIPYPATYLNGKRWEDEVDNQPSRAKPQNQSAQERRREANKKHSEAFLAQHEEPEKNEWQQLESLTK